MMMASLETPITRTKVSVPRRRADLLSRARLLNLLEQVLDRRLVIVTAPGGYGKTSLLLDFAHQTDLPVCWYHLDPLDQDPQRFIAHFVAAIAERFPNLKVPLRSFLEIPVHDSHSLDHLVSSLVNEVYERISEHFVLILDDYQEVDACETINTFVNRFVQVVDENCHIVIASRRLLSLPDLPQMVARSQVDGLDYDDLAFRPDEIKAWVLQNYGETISDDLALELVRKTEGWITGLLLSADTIWQGMPDQTRVVRASGVGLDDYLSQLLQKQPPVVQEFLLCTSLLEEFDSSLCQNVLGDAPPGESWRALIDTVSHNSLFVIPVDDGGTWLRYHPLFRDFLQRQLVQERPGEKQRILRRLAQVYTEKQMWESAYALYQRLGDDESRISLTEKASYSLMESGRNSTLANWIDKLPYEVLAARPTLIIRRAAVALNLGEVDKGLTLLNQAVENFRFEQDFPGLARALSWRSTAHRRRGDFTASLADSDEVLSISEGDESLLSARAEALKAKGLVKNQLGQIDEAISLLSLALAVFYRIGDDENAAIVNMDLGFVHMNAGSFDKALKYDQLSLDHWRTTGNAARQANLLNNLGVLHHKRGEYELAAQAFEEALECTKWTGDRHVEAFTLASLGDLYADLDAPGAALKAYHQAKRLAQRLDNHTLLVYLSRVETTLARAEKDFFRARELLESSKPGVDRDFSAYEIGSWELESGRLALEKKEFSGAVSHLENAFRHFRVGDFSVEAAGSCLFLSLAYHYLGEEKTARSYLARAFEQSSRLDNDHTLVVVGREAQDLLRAVGGDSAVSSLAADLIEKIDRFESRIPALRQRLRRLVKSVSIGPPRLTVQTLGDSRVEINGEPLDAKEWTQQRSVRELFFLLLSRPDGLTKDAIGNLLWSEVEPKKLSSKFKNSLYRLRRALGSEVVIEESGRYKFNRWLDYQCDVELFDQRLAQARESRELSEQLDIYRSALELYVGPYLLDVGGTWVVEERERLRRAFTEGMQAVIHIFLEDRSYQNALEFCERLIAVDPFLEAAYRLSMQAYAGLADRAGIVRQFERCVQNLEQGLGVSPSPQTKNLFRSLTGE